MEKYEFKVSEGFEGKIEEKVIDGITYLYITASSEKPGKPEIFLKWETPDSGTNVFWHPATERLKQVHWNLKKRFECSCSFGAPVISNVGYDDINALTIAVSDSIDKVSLFSGVIESNANMENKVEIRVGDSTTEFRTVVRIDERPVPFYKAIGEVGEWWRNECGFVHAPVPESARDILYSTWYAFLQNPDSESVYNECEKFGKLGCKTVILDDGWQADGEGIPMGDNGDWIASPKKFPDMKKWVESLHAIGYKVMLWFPAPLLGKNTETYKKFKEMTHEREWGVCDHVLMDPRFPEIRKMITDTYKRVMTEWNLDGLKLDYLDSYDIVKPASEGMDHESILGAVKTLLREIREAITSVKPDAMIEFRQNYVSPEMHTCCNMLRAMDCPNDSYANRMYTLDLRLLAGETAVHSDMLMWNEKEPADQAAYQLTNVLFSVPQISVRWNEISDEQKKMVENYLKFFADNREVLQKGEMIYKGLAQDYSFVSSFKNGIEVAAVYSGRTAYIREDADVAKIVHAAPAEKLIIEAQSGQTYSYVVKDCFGSEVDSGVLSVNDELLCACVYVPQNGILELEKQ